MIGVDLALILVRTVKVDRRMKQTRKEESTKRHHYHTSLPFDSLHMDLIFRLRQGTAAGSTTSPTVGPLSPSVSVLPSFVGVHFSGLALPLHQPGFQDLFHSPLPEHCRTLGYLCFSPQGPRHAFALATPISPLSRHRNGVSI